MRGGLKLGILTDLVKYLGILFIGGVFGYKNIIKGKLADNLGTIQNICLLFLLFVMGISIGMNDEVVNNILEVGVQALVISVCTIVFSVLFIRIVKRFVKIKGGEQDDA